MKKYKISYDTHVGGWKAQLSDSKDCLRLVNLNDGKEFFVEGDEALSVMFLLCFAYNDYVREKMFERRVILFANEVRKHLEDYNKK